MMHSMNRSTMSAEKQCMRIYVTRGTYDTHQPKKRTVGPVALLASRSCRNPRSGATPVPGPTVWLWWVVGGRW